MWCPEEEKKEKREEKSMPALFMEINRQYGMRCMQRIREIGIQQGQMPIIMIVYRNNGCSQKEIAERMGVTPPTVNVSIQRLEKAVPSLTVPERSSLWGYCGESRHCLQET